MTHDLKTFKEQVTNRLMGITGMPYIDIHPIIEAHSRFLRTTLSFALSHDQAIEYCAQTLNTLYY